MAELELKKGRANIKDNYHDLKNTPFEGIVFDLNIRLNKCIAYGSGIMGDNYISLVNHFEDLISPMMSEEETKALNRELKNAKDNVMKEKSISEAESEEEDVKPLIEYVQTRARLRFLNKILKKKVNFYPVQLVDDEIF